MLVDEPIWQEIVALITSHVSDEETSNDLLRYPEDALRFVSEECGDAGADLLEKMVN
jgi:hypothetical protein